MRVIFALLIAALFAATPARSQNSDIIDCGSFDTTVNGTTAFATLGVCNFTTGPAGTVLVLGNAEAGCGVAGETIQFFIASGTSPIAGSNFLGHVASGVLTVESIIPGLGASPYLIQTGQFLTGGTGAFFTPTAITGQLTQSTVTNSSLSWAVNTVSVVTSSPHPFTNGNAVTISGATPSGYNGTFLVSVADSTHFSYSLISNPGAETVPGSSTSVLGSAGTYNIADGSLSQSAGTNLYTLNPLPGGMTALTPAQSQNACSTGFIITAPVGAITLTPRAQYWIGLSLKSGANGQSATWNNSSWQVVVY